MEIYIQIHVHTYNPRHHTHTHTYIHIHTKSHAYIDEGQRVVGFVGCHLTSCHPAHTKHSLPYNLKGPHICFYWNSTLPCILHWPAKILPECIASHHSSVKHSKSQSPQPQFIRGLTPSMTMELSFQQVLQSKQSPGPNIL